MNLTVPGQSEIQLKPGAGTRFRAEKTVHLPENPKVFGHTGTPSLEHEPCPFQHQENALTDLKAARIARCKRSNLIHRDLPVSGKAFRHVAAPTPLNNAA
jgi:hypothetical protein